MKKKIVWILLIIVLVSASIVPAENKPFPKLTDTEKLYGLSYFWMEATYNFAYFHQVPDLNWDSAYQAFIPQVMADDNIYDYYRTLQKFAALLKDGHTSVGFPKYVFDSISFPKIQLNEFDHIPTVINVDSSLEQDIPIGSQIISVNGMPYEEYLSTEVFPYIASSTDHVLWDSGVKTMLRGWINTDVTIKLRKPDNTTNEIVLTRNRDGVKWVREKKPERQLFEFRQLTDNIDYIYIKHFNTDSIVTMFEKVLPQLSKAKGIVIDIRDNQGGNTGNATAILGYFTDKPLTGSKWSTPQTIAAYRAWGVHAYWNGETPEKNEQVRHFMHKSKFYGDTWVYTPPEGKKLTVPVAVLINRGTFSAAEDFLIFADSLQQFTYIGEPTNGSTGQPLFYNEVPGGGSWRICTKQDTYPDGRDFVGYGVQPDIRVKVSISDFLKDSDPVLDSAISYLNKKI